jgi:hypothetical protein
VHLRCVWRAELGVVDGAVERLAEAARAEQDACIGVLVQRRMSTAWIDGVTAVKRWKCGVFSCAGRLVLVIPVGSGWATIVLPSVVLATTVLSAIWERQLPDRGQFCQNIPVLRSASAMKHKPAKRDSPK